MRRNDDLLIHCPLAGISGTDHRASHIKDTNTLQMEGMEAVTGSFDLFPQKLLQCCSYEFWQFCI